MAKATRVVLVDRLHYLPLTAGALFRWCDRRHLRGLGFPLLGSTCDKSWCLLDIAALRRCCFLAHGSDGMVTVVDAPFGLAYSDVLRHHRGTEWPESTPHRLALALSTSDLPLAVRLTRSSSFTVLGSNNAISPMLAVIVVAHAAAAVTQVPCTRSAARARSSSLGRE
jgi:hypothetical protein